MPEITTQAPEGAHFEFEEVKTDKGTKSLGEVPILVWDKATSAIEFYGEDAIRDVLDGTSLRVSFQSIARRYKGAGKSDDDIAKAMIEFRPGKRAVGASTPASRSARAAKAAVEKGAVNEEQLSALLEKIAKGEISMDQLGIAAAPATAAAE